MAQTTTYQFSYLDHNGSQWTTIVMSKDKAKQFVNEMSDQIIWGMVHLPARHHE